MEAIVKISKRQLTPGIFIVKPGGSSLRYPEKSVLNKGLNFATTNKRIPYLDLIAPNRLWSLKNSQG